MMSEKPKQKSSPLRVMKAVLWSFFGIRKHSEYEEDITSLKPSHVIIAGILAAAIFVASLITLVHFITR